MQVYVGISIKNRYPNHRKKHTWSRIRNDWSHHQQCSAALVLLKRKSITQRRIELYIGVVHGPTASLKRWFEEHLCSPFLRFKRSIVVVFFPATREDFAFQLKKITFRSQGGIRTAPLELFVNLLQPTHGYLRRNLESYRVSTVAISKCTHMSPSTTNGFRVLNDAWCWKRFIADGWWCLTLHGTLCLMVNSPL